MYAFICLHRILLNAGAFHLQELALSLTVAQRNLFLEREKSVTFLRKFCRGARSSSGNESQEDDQVKIFYSSWWELNEVTGVLSSFIMNVGQLYILGCEKKIANGKARGRWWRW